MATRTSPYGPFHESLKNAESNVEQLVDQVEAELDDVDEDELDAFELLYRSKVHGVLTRLTAAKQELFGARLLYEQTMDLADDGQIVPDED